MRAEPVLVAVAVAVAVAAAAEPLRAESPDAPPLRLTASTVIAVGRQDHLEPARVRVSLRRFSTAEESAAQSAALDGGMRAYARELAKTDLGTVQLDPGTTHVVGFASRVVAPFGEVIRLVTAQPFVRVPAGGDYVGMLEIRLPADSSEPHGSFVAAAVIAVDDAGQPYPVDAPSLGWAAELTDIRRSGGSKRGR
jgi:hypothetical protein